MMGNAEGLLMSNDNISRQVKERIALERHDFMMKVLKSSFTIAVALVFIFTFLVLYASYTKNEFPTASDVVSLIDSMLTVVVKVL